MKVGLLSSVLAPVTTATMPTTTSVAISATRNPTPAYHGGQRGAAPSGSSGRSGGGGVGSIQTCSTASQSRAGSSRSEEMASTSAGGSPSR